MNTIWRALWAVYKARARRARRLADEFDAKAERFEMRADHFAHRFWGV